VKYAFFIGCVTPVMARQNEISTRRVAQELGVELMDVFDFACCGFPIKSVSVETSLLLAARNLSIAEERGLNICTICTGCTSILKEANQELQENDRLRAEVNEKLHTVGREYTGGITVKHFAKILYEDIGVEKLQSEIKKSLEALTIASHYGCHYLKPSRVFGSEEDPEFPSSLDELVALTGAKNIDYEEKIQCCGGNILGVDETVALTIASRKLDHIQAVAANALNLVCPLCNIVYDRNQRIIERRRNKEYKLPVLFYPQILGLALGISPEELGFHMNRTQVSKILNQV
jgi:heterodisulfide reductase subunit B